MARPKKPGDVEYPQVSLRGRQLDVIRIVANADDSSLPDAVRKVLDLWINSEEGRQYILDNYRFDVTRPRTPRVVSIGDPRRGSTGA